MVALARTRALARITTQPPLATNAIASARPGVSAWTGCPARATLVDSLVARRLTQSPHGATTGGCARRCRWRWTGRSAPHAHSPRERCRLGQTRTRAPRCAGEVVAAVRINVRINSHRNPAVAEVSHGWPSALCCARRLCRCCSSKAKQPRRSISSSRAPCRCRTARRTAGCCPRAHIGRATSLERVGCSRAPRTRRATRPSRSSRRRSNRSRTRASPRSCVRCVCACARVPRAQLGVVTRGLCTASERLFARDTVPLTRRSGRPSSSRRSVHAACGCEHPCDLWRLRWLLQCTQDSAIAEGIRRASSIDAAPTATGPMLGSVTGRR